jgi:heptaprenyl diphosphate synthase
MLKTHSFVSAEDVRSAKRVLAWARNYLTREHESVRRPYPPQTVCPYVEASIKANSLYLVFHNELNGRDLGAIADVILGYVRPFKEAPPFARHEQALKALLIVFPNIEEKFLTVLDECHRTVKPRIVNFGLMIGQFHPRCRERAIHNHEWDAISKSPVPLVAIRHMTIHDIMFLHDNEEAFRAYESRFGCRFAQRGESLFPYQKHLITYYERAKSAYARLE